MRSLPEIKRVNNPPPKPKAKTKAQLENELATLQQAVWDYCRAYDKMRSLAKVP